MTKEKRLEFRGRLATYKEIAAETGCSRYAVGRHHDGVRFFEKDERTDPFREPHPNTRLISHEGITDSVSGWARRAGMNRYTLSDRLDSGYSIKDALTKPVQLRTHKPNAPITFRGESMSVVRWAARMGLKRCTLSDRLYFGWPIKRALLEPATTRAERAQRKRIIRRMVEGFHAPSVTRQAIPDAVTPPPH